MNIILGWLLELWRRFTRTLDWPLLAALCALMGIGLAVLHSASGQSAGMVAAQAVRYGVGLAAMWLLSRMTPLRLRAVTPAFYALSIIPLVMVLFLGTGRYGQHWLNLGVFYFQPAELMKLSLPMMAAWYLNIAGPPPRPGAVLLCLAIIALPTGLIMLQPDLGTAVLVAASGLFALYLAGLSWWWFAAVAGVVAAAAPAAWFWMLQPYQKDRLLTFLDPERDPLGAGWNIIQSKIAIGAGGLAGQGWGKARSRTWTSCPSTPPTSSSRCWPRSSAGSAWPPCWRCTPS